MKTVKYFNSKGFYIGFDNGKTSYCKATPKGYDTCTIYEFEKKLYLIATGPTMPAIKFRISPQGKNWVKIKPWRKNESKR